MYISVTHNQEASESYTMDNLIDRVVVDVQLPASLNKQPKPFTMQYNSTGEFGQVALLTGSISNIRCAENFFGLGCQKKCRPDGTYCTIGKLFSRHNILFLFLQYSSIGATDSHRVQYSCH